MFHKLFTCVLCCLALCNIHAQQSNLTVETIATNVFNTTVTPSSYESSNGLTYFMDKGTIANVSVTGVAGKAVWTDGTSAGTHSVNIPTIKEHLGIIDSVYYGIDEQRQLFKFTSGTGITVLQERFQKVCEFVKLGNMHYFLGIPVRDSIASVWRVDAQGLFTQMATIRSANAVSSTYPLFLKTNGQYLLSLVAGKLHRFDANSASGVLLLDGVQGYRKLIVDTIGATTYFCVANRIYQTDGTAQNTIIPSAINYINAASFDVYQNHLYVFHNYRFSIGHGILSATGLVVFDGVRVIHDLQLSTSGMNGVFLNNDVAETIIGSNGKLYIFSNRMFDPNSAGAYVEVWATTSPQQIPTRVASMPHYSFESSINTNFVEYSRGIIFDVFTPYLYSAVGVPPGNGYYELDMAHGVTMPVSLQNARLLGKFNNAIYGQNERSLQALLDCPLANNRPIVSNVNIDTVSGMLRIRWDGPINGSVESYEVMTLLSPNSVSHGFISGNRVGLVVGATGQSSYEFISSIPLVQGPYHYGLRVNSAFGACGDTSVFVGTFINCYPLLKPNVTLDVHRINDLNNATVTASISPMSPDIVSVILLRNGAFAGYFAGNTSGRYTLTDQYSNSSSIYAVSITSNNPCWGNWVVTVTTLDTFSCSSIRPHLTFNQVAINANNNDCPTIFIDYTIQSSQSNYASLNLGSELLNSFYTNVGVTNYQQRFALTRNSGEALWLSVQMPQGCPDYQVNYSIRLSPSSYFYSIESARVEPIPTRNQVKLEWKTKNRTLPNQVFEIYKNWSLMSTNLTYSNQDSIFTFIDTFVQEGYLFYQINSVNYGQCNTSAAADYTLLCDPSNPSQIVDISLRELSATQRLISWRVEGGRTTRTLTGAQIREFNTTAHYRVLMPELNITNLAESEVYTATVDCANSSTLFSVRLAASNPNSRCMDDSEFVICDCNTIAQEDVSVVFPNPVHNTFTIYYPEGTIKAGVQLYDGVGALVREYGEQPNYCNLDMSGLPQGFYFLKLQYSTSFEMVKMEKL